MNGIEKISARILADAEAEAAAIRGQAEEKAAQIAAVTWIIVTTKIEHDADKNGVEEDIVAVHEDDGEEVPHEEIPTNLWQLLCVSGLTILALVGGVQGVLKDCMSTWVPTFIEEVW